MKQFQKIVTAVKLLFFPCIKYQISMESELKYYDQRIII